MCVILFFVVLRGHLCFALQIARTASTVFRSQFCLEDFLHPLRVAAVAFEFIECAWK